MSYIIGKACIGCIDTGCLNVCPVDCIHRPIKNDDSGRNALNLSDEEKQTELLLQRERLKSIIPDLKAYLSVDERIALKLKLDLDVLDAETVLLESYNKAYSDSLKLRDIDAKTKNTRAKLVKSEQEKDAELKVQINTLAENINAEKADTKRKTELLKLRNEMLGP